MQHVVSNEALLMSLMMLHYEGDLHSGDWLHGQPVARDSLLRPQFSCTTKTALAALACGALASIIQDTGSMGSRKL